MADSAYAAKEKTMMINTPNKKILSIVFTFSL